MTTMTDSITIMQLVTGLDRRIRAITSATPAAEIEDLARGLDALLDEYGVHPDVARFAHAAHQTLYAPRQRPQEGQG